MKNGIQGIAAMMLTVLAGCGGGAGGSAAPAPPPPAPTPAPIAIDLTKFQTCSRPTCDANWVSELHIDQWYWSVGTIHDESVIALANSDGSPPRYGLWRTPASSSDVLQVTWWSDGHVLTPGTDYTVSAGKIQIPPGSSVQLAASNFPFVSDPTSQYADRELTKEGGPLLIGDYSSHQLQVTYRPATMPNPPQGYGTVPKFAAKLAACQPMAVTLYGDSISEVGRYPYLNMLASFFEHVCPGAIHYRNQSVGGYASADAATSADTQLNDTASDLVILAFGINDAGPSPVSQATYSAHIAAIMTTVKAKAPNTEFVLIAGAEGNPDWVDMSPAAFPDYEAALDALAGSGVVSVDVTDAWHGVLGSKSYYDVTMNGVNHPSDWGMSIYTQAILRAIGSAP